MTLVYSKKFNGNTRIIASFKSQPIEKNIVSVSFSKYIYFKKGKGLNPVRLFLKLSRNKSSNDSYNLKFYFNNVKTFDYNILTGENKNLFDIWQNPRINNFVNDFIESFKNNYFYKPINLPKTFFNKNKITKKDISNYAINYNKNNIHECNYVASGIHLYYLKNNAR